MSTVELKKPFIDKIQKTEDKRILREGFLELESDNLKSTN